MFYFFYVYECLAYHLLDLLLSIFKDFLFYYKWYHVKILNPNCLLLVCRTLKFFHLLAMYSATLLNQLLIFHL